MGSLVDLNSYPSFVIVVPFLVSVISFLDYFLPFAFSPSSSSSYKGMNIASDAASDGKCTNITNGIGMFNQDPGKLKPPRPKLYIWKLYLDSCATHYLVFADGCLSNVHEVEVYLKGHCNAGLPLL